LYKQSFQVVEEGSILDPIEGWIDKDCVAVWPRHKNEKEIYLYVEPCIHYSN
jgi:hypothetical protein